MNREDIIRMAQEAGVVGLAKTPGFTDFLEYFASLVAAAEREACVKILEAYQIPIGNSSAGELAAEWTYDALHSIRAEIKERGNK